MTSIDRLFGIVDATTLSSASLHSGPSSFAANDDEVVAMSHGSSGTKRKSKRQTGEQTGRNQDAKHQQHQQNEAPFFLVTPLVVGRR